MAYVNFKEEKVKVNNQLEKRKHNNEKLYSYILKHKDSISGYYPSDKYSFNIFNSATFGKKGVLGEEEFHIICKEDIVCTKFTIYKFSAYNIFFTNNVKFFFS